MYSQCPECLTRFRVTAAALRAAHGTVRCGRCGSAFDALPRLTDALPDEPEVPPSLGVADAGFATAGVTGADAGGGTVEPALSTDFHFSADDIEQVFVDARDWQKRFGAGEATAPPAAANAPVVFVHEPEAIEDITLEGERIVIEGLPELDDDLREIVGIEVDDVPAAGQDDAIRLPGGEPPPVDLDSTDQFEILRHAHDAEPAADDARGRSTPANDTASPPAPAHATTPTPAPVVPFRLRQRDTRDEAAFAEALDDDLAPRRGAWLWGLGALLLVLVLVAQVAHHFRQDLVRDANLGPLLRTVYARLGRPLAPQWDLAALRLQQWGAGGSAPAADGSMTVRASVRNDAGFAQPMPLLRLEFEDRFGGTVARRDFAPREWLKDPAQATRLLAPGATTEAALDVVDAGAEAVGYRLDVCMRDEAGAVRCAQDGAGPR